MEAVYANWTDESSAKVYPIWVNDVAASNLLNLNKHWNTPAAQAQAEANVCEYSAYGDKLPKLLHRGIENCNGWVITSLWGFFSLPHLALKQTGSHFTFAIGCFGGNWTMSSTYGFVVYPKSDRTYDSGTSCYVRPYAGSWLMGVNAALGHDLSLLKGYRFLWLTEWNEGQRSGRVRDQ